MMCIPMLPSEGFWKLIAYLNYLGLLLVLSLGDMISLTAAYQGRDRIDAGHGKAFRGSLLEHHLQIHHMGIIRDTCAVKRCLFSKK